jgi:NTP pyrophosphatase (non-canonical NTP hydrolase)
MEKYIRSLSKKDKKTLSQKALKLTEETGELAKVVLPYDSAPGTNHRFVDRKKLLQEIADVYLANISIAYSLDFTTEEIENMILEKAKFWDSLQVKEEKGTFPLPFEIHITITNDELKENKEEFIKKYKEDCKALNVKPIILDLPVNKKVIKDVMTSSKFIGDNKGVYLETERISNGLKQMGYNVIRKKIETVPWHPSAPQENNTDTLLNNCYFESHIGVLTTPKNRHYLEKTVSHMEEVLSLSGTVKLSQNFFKKSENEDYINMLTYRNYKTNTKSFEKDVEAIKRMLTNNLFKYEKVIIEYCIYDTNVKHDFPWLN